MARVKRAVHSKKHRRATLERAKGYYGNKSRSYRAANEQVMHSLQYAYRDRRARKGEFRKLWIQRINAACRAERHQLQPVHQRAEGGRGRGRPQGAGRPRRHRPGGLRRPGRRWPTPRRADSRPERARPDGPRRSSARNPRVAAICAAWPATGRARAEQRAVRDRGPGAGGRRPRRRASTLEAVFVEPGDADRRAASPTAPRRRGVPVHRVGRGALDRVARPRSRRRPSRAVGAMLPTSPARRSARPRDFAARARRRRRPGQRRHAACARPRPPGSGAVLFCGGAVDPFDPKCVRASAGVALPRAGRDGRGAGAGARAARSARAPPRRHWAPTAARAYDEADLTGPLALVLGQRGPRPPGERGRRSSTRGSASRWPAASSR